MTTAARRARSQQGFTLVELLVTITLLSLVVVLLFGGLRFGVRAWDDGQAQGLRTDDLAVAQGLLRREIEQAYPLYQTTDALHPSIAFHGDEDSLTFLAPAPLAVAGRGRSRITLSVQRARDGGALAIRGMPELASGTNEEWSAPLVRGVAAARFSYFDGERWEATWESRDVLPILVRLQVVFRHGDGRVWPDLVVAPRIATDVGCIYDFTTQRCRGRP